MPENVHIHMMNLGEMETEVLRKLWRTFSEDDDGWPKATDFDETGGRLTRTRVRKKLNQSLMEVCAFAKVLKGWFILPVKEDYSQYPTPLNVMDIVSPIYYFTGATDYKVLEVYDDTVLDDIASGWRTETGTEPRYAYAGYTGRTQRFLGITPTPSEDATAVTLDSSVLEKEQPYGAVEAVSGSCGPASTATSMVDANSQNFSDLGVVPGMFILNTSDDARGIITSLTTTSYTNDTIVCSGGLTGGTNNSWTAGDEFRIIGGTYGGYIEIGDTEASFLVGQYAGDIPLPKVTMASGNILCQCYLYPTLLRDLNQYPELPPLFHQAVPMRAAAHLAMEFPMDTPEFKQGGVYMKESNNAVALASGLVAEQFKGKMKFLQSRRR